VFANLKIKGFALQIMHLTNSDPLCNSLALREAQGMLISDDDDFIKG